MPVADTATAGLRGRALGFMRNGLARDGFWTALDQVVVSGSGEFLAQRTAAEAMPDIQITKLSEEISPVCSAAACAYALAALAKKYWDWEQ